MAWSSGDVRSHWCGDLGADWYARRDNEAHTRRLVRQLEKLGHTVHLDPAA